METAGLFVKQHPWHWTAEVHKELMNGKQTIVTAILLMHQVSGDVEEAMNENLKPYHGTYFKKCSRRSTNEDFIHSLSVS
jgi:hypothetical protein